MLLVNYGLVEDLFSGVMTFCIVGLQHTTCPSHV
jgi:hypothetical protein